MSMSFIIVDDSEGDRYLARRVVAESGHAGAVVEFADGQGLLDLLHDEAKFDGFRNSTPEPYLVLLDINMPVVGGFEVAEELQAWQARHDEEIWFVVMMLTSSAHPSDLERASRYEVVEEFATKPLEMSALQRIVARFS